MPERTPEEIGQQIIDQLAGCDTDEAFEILAAVLGTSIGGLVHFSGGTEYLAFGIVEEIAENAKTHIRENWGQVEMAPTDG